MPTSLSPRVMLVGVGLAWGLSWPFLKIALQGFPPFTLRTVSMLLSAATVWALAKLAGQSLRIPPGRARIHAAIGGVLNVGAFAVLSALAQMHASSTRVTIVAYTMPIWTCLLSFVVLGERIDRPRAFALALCAVGLAILIYPISQSGVPLGILFALATGMAMAAGAVYLKWAIIRADPLGLVFWHFVSGVAAVLVLQAVFEGMPVLSHATPTSWAAVAFLGIIGSGMAYYLFFALVMRVPASTASLGILSVPVVGVIGSVILVGDRPTWPDMIGFGLIFSAAACVLLAPKDSAAMTAKIAGSAPRR